MKRFLCIMLLSALLGVIYNLEVLAADTPGRQLVGETYEMLTANLKTVINTRDINYITIHSVNIKQATVGRSELIINVEIIKSTGEHVFEQYVETLEPGHSLYSTFVSNSELQTVGE